VFRLVLDGANVGHCQSVPLVGPAEHLSVEVGENSPLGPVDEFLDTSLQSPPLELGSDELVAAHDGADAFDPAAADQRTATSLRRLERRRVFVGLVVSSVDGIVCNVDPNNFALPGASQPFFSPARGWLLVTAFPSPATTSACAKPIPGSEVPTCHFAPCYLAPLPVRPFRSATDAGLHPASTASSHVARYSFSK
jgi:hypothetical protein